MIVSKAQMEDLIIIGLKEKKFPDLNTQIEL